MPHRPRGCDTRYGYGVQANWRAWEDYYESGKCNEIQSQFFQPKSLVELSDTYSDPWHITNIANKPEFQKMFTQLSDELDGWMIETRDIGLIPEPMFHELVGEGKKYRTIYEYAQSDEYSAEEILSVAKNSSLGNKNKLENYMKYIVDKNPVVLFWGAYAAFLTQQTRTDIQSLLKNMINNDVFAANRIIAAQAPAVCGDPDFAFKAIMKETDNTKNNYVFLLALNAFQYSYTDNRLTIEDWKRFEKKKFPENDTDANLGYHQRIIADAISLWPERRKVY